MPQSVEAILGPPPPKSNAPGERPNKPPAREEIPSGDLTLAQRFKRWVGLPVDATNADEWKHKQAASGKKTAEKYGWGTADEALQGAYFGGVDEIDHMVNSALYGKPYADAYGEAQKRARTKYKAENPIKAATANLGGNVAGVMSGGRLLGGAAEALGVGEKVAPALKVVSNVGKALSPVTAAGGAIAGYEHGGEVTGSKLEGTLEGAELGFLAPRHLGSTLLGGALGATQGALEADPGQRAEGAKGGAIGGAVAGAVLPAVGSAAKQGAGAIDAATGYKDTKAVRALGTWWNNMLGRPAETRLTPPEEAAVRRIAAANEAEAKGKELTPERIVAEQNRRKALGLPKGKTYQMAGPQLQRVARTATLKSATAKDAAEGEWERVGEDLPHEVRRQAEALVPPGSGAGSVDQQIEALERARSSAAATQYREPYAQPVKLDDKAIETLDNREMRTAMDTARRVAEARVDDPEAARIVKDIDGLKDYYGQLDAYHAEHAKWAENDGMEMPQLDKAQSEFVEQIQNPEMKKQILAQMGAKPAPEPVRPEPPEVTAGAVDRIRIAAQRRAESLKNVPGQEPKDTHDLGVAVGQRAGKVDEYLESLDHLKEARGNYKGYTDRITALREGEGRIFSDQPADFAKWVKGLPPEAKGDLRIALRDLLTGKGRDTVNASAIMRKLDRDVVLQDNIKTILGEADATKLFEAAKQSRDDFRGAQFVSGAGSTTPFDQESGNIIAEMGHALHSPTSAMRTFLRDMLAKGSIMSPAEAEAIVQFNNGDPHALMDAIEKQPHGVLAKAVRAGMAASVGGYAANMNKPLDIEDDAGDKTAPPAPAGGPQGATDPFGDPIGPTAPQAAPAPSVGGNVDAFGDPVHAP